jgi:hypothetical protein
MSRRLGGHIDPTTISSFKYGSTEYDKDLSSAILKNTRHLVDKNKVALSVTQNLMQWSLFKKELQAKSAQKKDMLRDASKFQSLGIANRESLASTYSKFG